MNKLNVLIVGTGMYTCGRGTDLYGTVMPAILEWNRADRIENIYLFGMNTNGIRLAQKKVQELNRLMNVSIPNIQFFSMRPERDYLSNFITKHIEKPACSIVVVPDHAHEEVASQTIRGGLHTLVVKPLAPTIVQARRLLELQRAGNVWCAVEFHKRLDIANIKLRDAIDRKTIGDPLYFIVEYSQKKSVPSRHFKKWAERTNVFQYLGVHYVDIIYFTTGAIPIRVTAIGQKNWLASRGVDTYDTVHATIEWRMPGGRVFSSNIATNWVDPESGSAMSDQRIKVIGTKGRYESDQKYRGVTIVRDGQHIEQPNHYFCCPSGRPGETRYTGYGIDSIKQFLDDAMAIEHGSTTIERLSSIRPSFAQAMISTAVVEAVNKSLANKGRWVNINVSE